MIGRTVISVPYEKLFTMDSAWSDLWSIDFSYYVLRSGPLYGSTWTEEES